MFKLRALRRSFSFQMQIVDRIREAIWPTIVHLCLSALVAFVAFVLVFWVWFPAPFDRLLAGRDLFWLMLSVDLVCGPLLTGVVFDRRKPRKELFIDLSVIGLLQLAALLYGLWSVHLSRPVVVAVEIDRFLVVSEAEVWHGKEVSPKKLPLFSVTYLGVRELTPSDHGILDSLELSLSGIPAGARQERWVPYDEVREKVRTQAKDLSELRRKHGTRGNQILFQALINLGLSEADVGYWPVQSKLHSDWVALVGRRDGDVKAYVQLDPW